MVFPCVKIANTKIQIQKDTNTHIHKYSIWLSARKTQHDIYLWEEECARISKVVFPCVKIANTKIQIQKDTNTHIHKYSKWWIARKTQHDMYLWKEDCARISKIVFPCVKSANTKIQRHKYTNTQIQHMMNNQKKIQNSMLGGGTKNIMPSRKYILWTWLILIPPPEIKNMY